MNKISLFGFVSVSRSCDVVTPDGTDGSLLQAGIVIDFGDVATIDSTYPRSGWRYHARCYHIVSVWKRQPIVCVYLPAMVLAMLITHRPSLEARSQHLFLRMYPEINTAARLYLVSFVSRLLLKHDSADMRGRHLTAPESKRFGGQCEKCSLKRSASWKQSPLLFRFFDPPCSPEAEMSRTTPLCLPLFPHISKTFARRTPLGLFSLTTHPSCTRRLRVAGREGKDPNHRERPTTSLDPLRRVVPRFPLSTEPPSGVEMLASRWVRHVLA